MLILNIGGFTMSPLLLLLLKIFLIPFPFLILYALGNKLLPIELLINYRKN